MNHESIIAQSVPTIPLSIYIHFPWCLSKCPYCDFNSFVLPNKKNISSYVDKLLFDIEIEASKNRGQELKSIYFGGGTPSLLLPDMLTQIIGRIKKHFILMPNIEITLEANPGTVDLDLCLGFKNAGINRFSVGVQSFNDESLKRIGRIHNADIALKAIEAVKLAGFSSFNIDLMFGLPGQNVETALQDLKTALDFSPNHISWYQLTLENESIFDELPQNEEIWNIQQTGQKILEDSGLKQYEVSAFSRSLNDRCRHNINYWQYGDYIGVGSGAHGKITLSDQVIKRYIKISSPGKYLQAENLIESEEIVSKEKISLEFMLNALRLYQSVGYDLFQERTGFTIDVVKERLQRAKDLGLIELQNESIITTHHGKNFLNDLLEVFL